MLARRSWPLKAAMAGFKTLEMIRSPQVKGMRKASSVEAPRERLTVKES